MPLVVQDLNFHAGVGRISIHGSAQGHATISSRGHLEFQPELEIPVFLFGHQPAAALSVNEEDAVFGSPNAHLAAFVHFPAGQVFAVEQRLKAFGSLLIC